MNIRKIKDDIEHSINILESNIKLFHDGNTSVYRVIAGQLRLLICDGNNSLMLRAFRNLKLHPLRGYKIKKEEEVDNKHLALRMPARVSFNGKGGSRIEKLFDESREPIAIDEWLGQELFNPTIPIQQLIIVKGAIPQRDTLRDRFWGVPK